MASCSVSSSNGDGSALFTRQKKFEKKKPTNPMIPTTEKTRRRKDLPMKMWIGNAMAVEKWAYTENCNVKMQGGNMAKLKEPKSEENWGKCFVAETTTIDALALINFKEDWIIDSGCSHHLIGNEFMFSSFRKYEGNDVIVTADDSVHSVNVTTRLEIYCTKRVFLYFH